MKTTLANAHLVITYVVALWFGAILIASGQSFDNATLNTHIEMHNVPITTAIGTLANQSRINFIIAPNLFANPNDPQGSGVLEPKVTFTWEDISPTNALVRLLKEHKQDLVMVQDPSSTIAMITRTNQAASPFDESLLGSETNGVIPMIRFSYMSLGDALNNLIQHNHLAVTLDPKLLAEDHFEPTTKIFISQPQVSVHWEGVTAKQAITALCQNYDLIIVKDAATGEVRIKPKN
jgi:hypothetical protein